MVSPVGEELINQWKSRGGIRLPTLRAHVDTMIWDALLEKSEGKAMESKSAHGILRAGVSELAGLYAGEACNKYDSYKASMAAPQMGRKLDEAAATLRYDMERLLPGVDAGKFIDEIKQKVTDELRQFAPHLASTAAVARA